jgi:uncharacterized protein
MKRRVSLSLILFLVTTATAWGEKVSALPQPTGYVDDYARVISSTAKPELERICRELHDKTRAQIFFVTVKTTEGEEVQTFANELFAKWKIGEKKTDRGVLILLSINDRKRWIEVGYGLEGILNDAKAGDIGRAMVPDLRASRYDAAARLAILEVSQIIEEDAGVPLEEPALNQNRAPPPVTEAPPSSAIRMNHVSAWPILIFFLFPPLVIGVLLLGMLRSSGLGGSSDSSSFVSSDNSSSSSGGGDSGGSDSFSGGDGGSSGGGGAGGDW